MPATLIIELGRQFPLFGHHTNPMPEAEGDQPAQLHQVNLGWTGFVWFGLPISDLLDRWKRVMRRDAWAAVTGGPPAEAEEPTPWG